jgi:4-hydroxy-tetrahydrodipicolinate synthase
LTEYLIENGVQGIWAMGTTGEFPALGEAEREKAIAATMEGARGRVPVIANIGAGGTKEAIQHARVAQRLGVDAIAATPTYYFPHAQDEMLTHYRAIRAAVDLPLFVYNFPQMVKIKLDVATVATLAAEGVIAGIKDSQNDLQWFRALMTATRAKGLDFRGFLGTRTLIDAGMVVGAAGAVPSVSNIAPRLCAEMYAAATGGDFRRAGDIQDLIIRYDNLSGLVKGGSQNAAVIGMLKAVLAGRGVIGGARTTLPLRQLTADEVQAIQSAASTLPTSAAVAA